MTSLKGLAALVKMLGLVLWVPLRLRRRHGLATTIAAIAGLEVIPTTMMTGALTAPVVTDTVPAIVVATAIAAAAAAVLARTPVPEPWRPWVSVLLPLLLVWPWPTRSMVRRAMTGAVVRAIVVTVLARASQEQETVTMMMTSTTAVSPNEENTLLVPVWLVPLPRVLSTGLAVTRGPVVGPGPKAKSARRFPSWQAALVRRVLRVSTRKTRRRRTMSDRDIGKEDIGRDLIAEHRPRCIPIPPEIRIT